jgi:diguanylate cyclase (GGDEF)-like protein/PAS domain S-box-containing protein
MSDLKTHPFFETVSRRFCGILSDQVGDGICYIDKDLKILGWNKSAEMMTGFSEDEMSGKSWSDDVGLHMEPGNAGKEDSACPVERAVRESTIITVDAFLPHKSGYRIPIHLRILPVDSDDGNLLGAAVLFSPATPLIMVPPGPVFLEHSGFLNAEIGIPNRNFLETILKKRLEEYKKFGIPFGLLYIDIDQYGQFKEKYGNFNAGKILRIIARNLQKNIRYLDVMGLWNADEFLVLLHNIEENRLDIVANKLRLMVAESYLMTETETLNATVSIGACLVQRYDTPESLVNRAHKLMMHSKWRGRNKVSLNFAQKDAF